MTAPLTPAEVLALPALVTVPMVGAALGGVGQATVYRQVAAGTLPLEPIRIGSRILFRRADILELLRIREDLGGDAA